MKSPEEIKNGIMEALEEVCRAVDRGDAQGVLDAANQASESLFEDLDCIRHFDARVPRWIPVEERLPEGKPPYCQTVNVRTIDGKVLPGFCNHGLWYVMREEDDFCNDADEGEVTHWMPLPEAPKEDEK